MKAQAGFSIIMAIFILVVLALLGGYMVKLSGVQHAISTNAIQGARAYQAARAGISWSIARISTGGACSDITDETAMTFTDINGFSVSFTCTSQDYSEGSDNLTVYAITALSEFDTYNNANYISRMLSVSIVN